MKRIVFLFLTCLSLQPMTLLADTAEMVDSLLSVYQATGRARHKVAVARQLMTIYMEEDVFLTEPPTLRDDLPGDSLDLYVWFATARFCYRSARYGRGLEYIEQAMPLTKKGHDDLRATMLCDKGYMLVKLGRIGDGISVEQEAAKFARKTNNLLQLSRAYLYIGICNNQVRQPDEAKRYVRKSIEIDRRMAAENKVPSPQAHNTLGLACEIYAVAGDLTEAESYGWQAVESARLLGDSSAVANHLSQLSYVYDRTGDYQRGITLAEQAIVLLSQADIPDRNTLALTIEYKAYNLLDMGEYEESIDALRKAMALQREVGNMRSYCVDLRTMAEAYSHIDSVQSLRYLNEYTRLYDSIYVGDTQVQISKANAEMGNEELMAENTALERRYVRGMWWVRRLAWGVIVLFLVMALLAWLFYCHDRTQQRRVRDLLNRLAESEKATRSLGLPEHMDTAAPDDADGFLSTVNATIKQLMPSAQADIEHVSAALGLSPSKFRRQVQTLSSLTPGNYIMAIRMAEAQRLLVYRPSLTISDIALRCGFADNAHFTHAFQRIFGTSPRQFRESRGETCGMVEQVPDTL